MNMRWLNALNSADPVSRPEGLARLAAEGRTGAPGNSTPRSRAALNQLPGRSKFGRTPAAHLHARVRHRRGRPDRACHRL